MRCIMAPEEFHTPERISSEGRVQQACAVCAKRRELGIGRTQLRLVPHDIVLPRQAGGVPFAM